MDCRADLNYGARVKLVVKYELSSIQVVWFPSLLVSDIGFTNDEHQPLSGKLVPPDHWSMVTGISRGHAKGKTMVVAEELQDFHAMHYVL